MRKPLPSAPSERGALDGSGRRPMYRDDDLCYYSAPVSGVDYVELTPWSCLYVPQTRFRNLGPGGKLLSGPTERHALYRLIGAEGLLYIGIGIRPEGRWKDHELHKPWWPNVLVKTVDWHEHRWSAEEAEYVAIGCEQPKHNTLQQYPRRWCGQRHDAFREIDRRWA